MIRPFVVARKGWMFADPIAGATASGNLYSIIEICKAHKSEPFRYHLELLFCLLPRAHTVDDYEAPLPLNMRLPATR